MDDVAARINEALTEVGLSEPEACRQAGLAPTFIRDIREGRKASLRWDSLNTLAKVLKKTPEWIMEGRYSPTDPETVKLVEIFEHRIKREERPRVLRIVRSFGEEN